MAPRAPRARAPRARAPRGPNFTTIEDATMCKIHLAISQDAGVGTDQSEEALWTRIKDDIEVHLPNAPERTWSSWQKRYQGISKDVALFSTKEAEVEGEYHSGWGTELKLEEIKNRFKECNGGKRFRHEECYSIIIENIKYNRRSTFVFDTTHDLDSYENNEVDEDGHQTPIQDETSNNTDRGDIENTYHRQLGEKAAKRLKKTGREKSAAQEELMGIIIKEQQNFNTHYQAQSRFKMEQRAAEFAAKQAEHAAKLAKQVEDDKFRIIMMDLEKLDHVQREYFQLRRADIVRNRRNQS